MNTVNTQPLIGSLALAAVAWITASGTVIPLQAGEMTAQELQGKRIYERVCATCHGRNGDGKGPAADALDPRPRDFTSGLFKFSTTASGVQPLDSDLIRTVSEGVPGSWMPDWKHHLDRDEIAAAVSYIKLFSDAFDEEMYEEDIFSLSPERPAEFPSSSESAASGRLLYVKNQCAECHGESGRGDGPSAGTHIDSWGQPIMPPNLRYGVFRGGARPEDLFRTLKTGLGGTPMPAYGEILPDEELWQLVDYVISLRSTKKWRSYVRSAPTWEDADQGRR